MRKSECMDELMDSHRNLSVQILSCGGKGARTKVNEAQYRAIELISLTGPCISQGAVRGAGVSCNCRDYHNEIGVGAFASRRAGAS